MRFRTSTFCGCQRCSSICEKGSANKLDTVRDLPPISPPQKKLLILISNYQQQFAVHKLIIDRKTGGLWFDNDYQKGDGINLIHDLYESNDPIAQNKFEQLMETIPAKYLRSFQETRWDSPFVVSVTDEGLRYLKTDF
jgi:hypothetical protein